MSDYDREARAVLESAISTLVLLFPIYGTVFLYLNKIERKDLPTMAVGTTRRVDLALYYNPDFVKKLTSTQIRAVLKHEALHVLLHHISRNQYFNYNMKGYNYAADMAINCHIEGLPPNCLYPKNYGFPDNEGSEWYYGKLKEEAEKNGTEVCAGGSGELVDDHSMWGECDDEIIKEKIKGIADQAVKNQEQKGWGEVSGSLVQQILAANKPAVNWKKEVKYFIRQIVMMGRKATRMRPNRRFGYQNPGNKRDYTSKILVAIDTSGSVSDKLLQYFLTELNGMISHVRVDLIQFDHVVHGDPVPFEKRRSTYNFVGRGGTSFDAPIKVGVDLKYDGLIMFSDMQCSFPPKPQRLRILWCAAQENKSDLAAVPYGKKVLIEQKRD